MAEQEARDGEREALARLLGEELGWGWAGITRLLDIAGALIAAGYRKHPEPEITDEMVERAQQAFHDFTIGLDEPLTRREKGITRLAYRAALEAALRVPVGEGE